MTDRLSDQVCELENVRDKLAAELAQLRAQLTEVRTAPDDPSDYLRDAVADSDGIII